MKIILAADELGVSQIGSRIEPPKPFRTMVIKYCRGYGPHSSSANVCERGHIVGVALDEFIKEPHMKRDPSGGIATQCHHPESGLSQLFEETCSYTTHYRIHKMGKDKLREN